MSWAEIKKAINSNLRKPLDKLIDERVEEVKDILLKGDVAKRRHINKSLTNQNNIKVLNISGKGYIRKINMLCEGYSRTYVPQILIKIDGIDAINLLSKPTASSSFKTALGVLMGNNEDFFTSGSYGYQTLMFNGSMPHAIMFVEPNEKMYCRGSMINSRTVENDFIRATKNDFPINHTLLADVSSISEAVAALCLQKESYDKGITFNNSFEVYVTGAYCDVALEYVLED